MKEIDDQKIDHYFYTFTFHFTRNWLWGVVLSILATDDQPAAGFHGGMRSAARFEKSGLVAARARLGAARARLGAERERLAYARRLSRRKKNV